MFFVDITSTHLTFYDSYFALFFFIAHITLGNSVFYLSILLWRRKWQPTPALLPGKSHGWRSLIGYSPWGRKESDTTERLNCPELYSLSICQEVIRLEGEGNSNSLQHSCLGNPMDRGAWWAAVHGFTKGQTRLSDLTFSFHFHELEKEMATHSSILAWRIPGTGGA